MLRFLGTRRVVDADVDTQLEALLTNASALYRHLADSVIPKAGKAPEAEYRVRRGWAYYGHDLRTLLHGTAEAMTVLGVENISGDELAFRLKTEFEALEKRAGNSEPATPDAALIRLMIGFFFRGGNPKLGCAFTHKSFREYFFAEAIVETLKDFGREARELEQPVARDYWRNFDAAPLLDELSKRLATLLGTEWLSKEIQNHLRYLLDWETDRARSSTPAEEKAAGASEPCSTQEWASIRDALASIWQWWLDAAHLRPQAVSKPRSKGHDWCLRSRRKLPRQPVFLPRASLDNFALPHANLNDANLAGASLQHAILTHATIEFADFEDAILANADLQYANIQVTNLRNADLAEAFLCEAFFFRCEMNGAKLMGANIEDGSIAMSSLADADLTGSKLDGANIDSAQLNGATLSKGALAAANVSKTDLSQVLWIDAGPAAGAPFEASETSRAIAKGTETKP